MPSKASGKGQVQEFELRPGYRIPRLINGGWQLSEGHDPTANVGASRHGEAKLAELRSLVNAGLTTFDGADIYTGVEALYGRLLSSLPSPAQGGPKIRIHTKLVPDLEVLPRISQTYVETLIDRSLNRLGTDCLDLVQFHWWDWAVDGWLDTLGWLDQLRAAGKIRHLGVTNFDSRRLSQVLDQGIEVVAHQLQYSLLDRRPERSMVALCRRHRVHLLCYGTLAGGFLSDRWLNKPAPAGPLANRSLVKYRLIIEELGGWSAFQELLRRLDTTARRHGVSIANVAVRWVLDRPGVAATVVGVRNADHLQDNLRIFGFQLSPDDLSSIESLLGRYSGAEGDVYSVERVPGGKHAVIMKTGLNRSG